ncbi:MAG: N-acetylneuraminate synthase family protein [Bacteroidetes bacterium]|nr:N-acetylneuraminate synthase family protein [Bacteroidota bacterium]
MVKIIAEIGWNHMGDMNLAKEMIISAAASGADICKFQTWSEERLKRGGWDTDGRREIYKKAQLSHEDHIFLKRVCEEKSVKFLTSIFDINDLEFLDSLDMKMIKIPSHEVYNLDLISAAANTFEIILVSTGAAKWKEIKAVAKAIDGDKLVFMQCVATYPCPSEKVNLPRMEELKKLTKLVGYSGHFPGIDDAIAAICHGASYVEKHFTIDQNLPGRDNKFAILPAQLKSISNFRNNYVKMNINHGLDLQNCELDTYNNYRGRWSKNG